MHVLPRSAIDFYPDYVNLIHPIAVKPFIKKYIGQQYPVDPFIITKTNRYGIFLFNCLSKEGLKVVHRESHQDSDAAGKKKARSGSELIDVKVYSDVLKVSISENYWQKKGGWILPQNQLDFNKLVEYDFHDEFFKYVSMRIGNKGSINKAILTFRDSFDISEDDLSFKTIQRAFQRRHAKINNCKSA